MSISQAMDRRLVKAFGSDGELRGRRFSQKDAEWLAKRGLVHVTRWNRTRDRIICIQFFGDSEVLIKPQRWLKTGTRYSYPEQVGNHKVWTHKSLPYRMVRADSDEPFNSVAINDRLRSLFAGPALSTVTAEPEPARNVVSIDSRSREAAPVEVEPEIEPLVSAAA